jgi:hypothetical protein
MRLPRWLLGPLRRLAWRAMFARDPDFRLPEYLDRWHLVRSRWGCVYLHLIIGSDDDRALHDHRSWTISVVLDGGYLEILEHGRFRNVAAGDVVVRSATALHRLQLLRGPGALTVFITGPHRRVWGFQPHGGDWMPHTEYLAQRDRARPEAPR